ncbi:ATP-binding protein [Paraburkholderia sp. J67]|uniref:ATP-binding protein n=1 Tax=Paraburkholderia sp. J67 TaxID=2805435 RepID=UPI002ABDBFCE|nr:ATP-binding protein [Paraburkholderia sp. J67]
MKRPNSRRVPGADHTAGESEDVQASRSVFNDPIFARTQRYVLAVYHEGGFELAEYAENPLILALPTFVNLEGTLRALAEHFAVACPEGCGAWPKEHRLMSIGRIDRLLIILPIHISLLEWMHVALRNHYGPINPTIDIHRHMQDAYNRIQSGKPGVIADLVEGHAACRALVGMSGTGKSTAVRLALSLFPPVIRHTEFRGIPCRFRQLVWIYVTCPANGSVKSFLKSILRWVDEHLDTHYLDEMQVRDSSDDYGIKVDVVLRRHFAGVLVIDEFQNLLRAAASTELLDTVVNLLNSRCCCMMVLGTPETEAIIKTRLRLARRVSSDGYEVMAPLSDDKVYKGFADKVLALNFLKKPITDPERVKAALLDHSAGLPALIKLLARLVQYMAIETKREQFTPELLEKVQQELLEPLTGVVKALRAQDSKALSHYVDILHGEAAQVHRRAMSRPNEKENKGIDDEVRSQTFASAVASLLPLGFTHSDADLRVSEVLRDMPALTSYGVVLEVLQRRELSRSPTAPPSAD